MMFKLFGKKKKEAKQPKGFYSILDGESIDLSDVEDDLYEDDDLDED